MVPDDSNTFSIPLKCLKVVIFLSCFHPLYRLVMPYSTNVNTGKPVGRIIPYLEVPNYLNNPNFELQTVPCGKCIGCRLQRSREWANRCMLELEYHKSAYFVTLTYNDEHVPTVYYPDPDTGEALPAHTLRKRDFQLFMKRLRFKFSDQKIRFFACGEYGPETMRPHYHVILFGLELHDTVPWSRSPQGFQYYLSQQMQEVWSVRNAPSRYGSINCLTADPEYFCDPIGHILVSEVSWETCAYVARYCTKKLTGEASEFYDVHNIEPPFSLMSTHPGIAKQWFVDHPDCYNYEYISVSTPTGGRKFRPPRYFDKLYDVVEPEHMAEIKESRQRFAEAAKAAKLSLSYYSDEELLLAEEASQSCKVRTLRRYL